MPAIFSKEKLEKVWQLMQSDVPRSQIAKNLSIHEEAIDAYILAAYKKFTVPVIRYKFDNQMDIFKTSDTAPKKQRKKSPSVIRVSRESEPKPFERVRAAGQYSNPDYSKMYM